MIWARQWDSRLQHVCYSECKTSACVGLCINGGLQNRCLASFAVITENDRVHVNTTTNCWILRVFILESVKNDVIKLVTEFQKVEYCFDKWMFLLTPLYSMSSVRVCDLSWKDWFPLHSLTLWRSRSTISPANIRRSKDAGGFMKPWFTIGLATNRSSMELERTSAFKWPRPLSIALNNVSFAGESKAENLSQHGVRWSCQNGILLMKSRSVALGRSKEFLVDIKETRGQTRISSVKLASPSM